MFTLEDIFSVPVFSRDHGVKILEILNEIFDDIDDTSLSSQTSTCNIREKFIFDGLEELLSSAYDDFEGDLLDPDTLPE